MNTSKTFSRQRLKGRLDKLYSECDFSSMISRDPIEFPHRYRQTRDIEIVGYIASCFAYGRVGLFKSVVEKTLSLMIDSPSGFVEHFDVKAHRNLFNFNYRFSNPEDILCLFHILHELVRVHGSIEKAFMKHFRAGGGNTGNGISGFVEEILEIDTSPVYGTRKHPHGLTHFFPTPLKGSACKRMNLFLRWMVRDRDIDFGIWKGIPKNSLVIPLDTHIGRISRCLGLTERHSSDWKAAIEITEALKSFDPDDPLKYDFALCHHGISGSCKHGEKGGCDECIFNRLG